MPSPLWEGVREGCGSCEFGHRSAWNRLDAIHVSVECRRYPPQLVQHVELSAYDRSPSYDIVPSRPNMAEDDWCGEYKRKIP